VAEGYIRDQADLAKAATGTGKAAEDAAKELDVLRSAIDSMRDRAAKGIDPSYRAPFRIHPPSPMNFLQGPDKSPKATPISLSLNIDGRTLAQTVSQQLADLLTFPTGAPAADGWGRWHDGDHNLSTT
jgi:hypothetical protein